MLQPSGTRNPTYIYTNPNILIKYANARHSTFQKFKYPLSSLPIVKGIIYSKTQSPVNSHESKEMSKIPYRSLIGHLSFLASRTRPDITFAVNIFSQFQSNPGMFHWNYLLKLLGYVRQTKHFKLNLGNINSLNITAYSDASFASCRDDRVSISGQIIFLDKVPICWRTSKQKCVCLSSMEAEFVALTDAVKELIWFQRILKECYALNIVKDNSVSKLLVDNQASIDFVKSPIENYKTKHIDIKLFFVRELVDKKLFDIFHVSSKRNLADAFTKPLSKTELENFFTMYVR